MSIECNCISLGEINRYIIFIIIGAIFMAGTSVIANDSKFFNPENFYVIIYTIANSLGLSLSFILLIIYKKYNKENKGNKLELISPLKNQNIKKKKKEKFFWILFVSIIDFISTIFSFLLYKQIYSLFIFWTSDFLFLYLFSYIIFKVKLQKHHYLSIITIMILGLLYDIKAEKFTYVNFKNNYLVVIYYIIQKLFVDFSYILYKYYMINKYIIFHEIMFYEGIIELILSIITLIITTNIGYLDNFWDYYNNLDSKEILIIILLIIFLFIYNFMKFKIIEIYLPYHILLLTTLYILIMHFINFDTSNIIVSIVALILILICFIMILIFVEIIELNCFGLSYMTKKNIKNRAQFDSVLANIEGDNDSRIDYQDYLIDLNDRKLSEMTIIEPKSFNDE